MDQLELSSKLLDLARAKGVMIATAESCTGGMIAAAITDVAGSSDVFDRGFVTYSNDAKMQMLGISNATLDQHGAVSEEIAREMAEGAMEHSNASLAVSVTGIAGPGGSEFKPEGMVCFGLAMSGKSTETQTIQFGAIGRANVRQKTMEHALNLMIQALS